ncbi:MAG: GreA/GreB family elongation factor [Parachlamydiales bacterium]|nr:GreA/GreB family elongation factor [Parachlamydiales bacterium]
MEMTYLNDFKEKIKENDYPGFIKIWEEYCYNDSVDYDELKSILLEASNSDIKEKFGQHVNRALSLYEKIQDEEKKHDIFKLIIDIQTRNDEDLASLVYDHLEKRYSKDPLFSEKIRIIGLRSRQDFQGAISKYELLNHIDKGKFVFHKAGWGTGEVLECSLLREELVLEFEYLVGHKSLSFENALKTLIPLDDNHFLARRFGNPDFLEKQAKENPVEIIKLLIQDLGPKSASEIKENLSELVIPSDEWNKWWQTARAKLKKDKFIESPASLNEPFKLRKKEVSHEEILHKSLENKPKPKEIIQMIHSFLRDFSETLKNEDFKNSLISKLLDVLSYEDVKESEKLQIYFFLETLKAEKELINTKQIIEESKSLTELLHEIDVISFKKRLLLSIRKYKKDWQEIFLDLFFKVDQNILRDYILQELTKAKNVKLKDKIKELMNHPLIQPLAFIWYFQKIISEKEKVPFSDKEGKTKFFEGFLILLDHLGSKPEKKDLAKKMVNILTGNKFELVRDIMKIANLEQVKEYILLSTKCGVLEDHDIKIIHSVAKVAHPSLNDYSSSEIPEDIIWMTAEGYNKLKNKIERLSSVEMIDNAKEIEEARSHGDLRENAEYKAALERRDRLQSEIKLLVDQISKAKLLLKEDVTTEKVNVGTVIDCKSPHGEKITFTILGPFEAKAEENIISFQSKLAKDILGKTIGEKFLFKNQEYTIVDIRNYFE